MAIASRTQSSLSPPISQASLVTSLLAAFADAGYASPVDNYATGTDRILVYRFDSDSTKTFGSNFLRVRVTTALQVFQQILTSWNSSTRTGNNGSSESTVASFAASVAIQFNSLNASTEYKFVVVTQGFLLLVLGVLCPQNKPAWWDINSWSWGFIFPNLNITGLRSSALNPYSNSDYLTFLAATGMSLVNPQTNRRDILAGIILLSASNAGAAGRTSDDLAIAAALNTGKFDILSFPESTSQYLIINNATGGLAVRIQ